MIKRQHDTDMYPGNNTHAPANQTNVPISLDCVALQKVFFFTSTCKRSLKWKGKRKKRKGKKKPNYEKKASIHVMLVSISEHLKIHGNFWNIYKIKRKKTRDKGDDGGYPLGGIQSVGICEITANITEM